MCDGEIRFGETVIRISPGDQPELPKVRMTVGGKEVDFTSLMLKIVGRDPPTILVEYYPTFGEMPADPKGGG